MEIKISAKDLEGFEKQDRTNLVNGLSGYKSAHLVGTQNKNGQQNLAIFSSVVHVGANPALMGFIQRPASVERHTYENILETGYFTINHVPLEYYRNAHQTSARFARNQSEFELCGFTPQFSEMIKAPYAAESPIKIGLSLEEVITIKANNTLFIVGKIQEILLDPSFLSETGAINLSKAHTILVHGLETYYKAEKIGELPYAKANLNALQKGQELHTEKLKKKL
ncbi:MAG: flavin reductase [bacterium]|nr:flavin reductase [bacterium]